MQQSVIKMWVFSLPLRMQSVLMSAIRGADGVPKEDKSKALVRALRGLLFNNADTTNSFMKDDLSEEQVEAFASDVDHYYVHFLMHFTHASEIVGYKHPDHLVRGRWIAIYKRICKSLHLNFETEAQLDVRLGHTPEFLEEQKKASSVSKTPVPKSLSVEAPQVSDRPIELDLEGAPVPKATTKSTRPREKCTCAHGFLDHYEIAPESQPGVYECSGGKCKCVKYEEVVPKPKQVPQRKVPSQTTTGVCICGHTEDLHWSPAGPVRGCRQSRCGCLAFVDRSTADAGTGTSRGNDRY